MGKERIKYHHPEDIVFSIQLCVAYELKEGIHFLKSSYFIYMYVCRQKQKVCQVISGVHC
jgi:hypothetical protein